MTEWLDGHEDCLKAWWYARDAAHACFYSLETLTWVATNWGWSMHTPSRNVVFYQTACPDSCPSSRQE